jgi:hypothetical protein
VTEPKLSDIAAQAVMWGLLETLAKERKDEARIALTKRMGPEAVAVQAIANGANVGRASWVEGKDKPVVVNDSAFQAFVGERFPDELLTTVNPAFQRQFLSNLKSAGGYALTKDGEPVPGVEFRSSEPYVSIRKTPEARAAVEALLTTGGLSLDAGSEAS